LGVFASEVEITDGGALQRGKVVVVTSGVRAGACGQAGKDEMCVCVLKKARLSDDKQEAYLVDSRAKKTMLYF